MNKNEQIIKILNSFKLPVYEEIPDVGLYLDQVTKYINGYLKDFPGMTVTPSMISNYVKLKLISKANKKAYSRDQIAGFIFIVFAKTVLSMNHIQYLLTLQKEHYKVEDAYNYFREELISLLSSLESKTGMDYNEEEAEEKRMLHNVAVTIAYKMYLDSYFRGSEETSE